MKVLPAIHTIGSSVENKALQLCFRIFIFYDFTTKSIQNNQNQHFSADPQVGLEICGVLRKSIKILAN